jgi:hypothetical protein
MTVFCISKNDLGVTGTNLNTSDEMSKSVQSTKETSSPALKGVSSDVHFFK